MNQQAIVIGLGQYGMALARALSKQGVEVLAVDLDADRVQAAATFCEALAADAMDERTLERLNPAKRDLAVVAIGDEAREASIMATALLRQLGAKRIIARATDDLHDRVLRQVGAHEVVHPERSAGERLAQSIAHKGLLDSFQLGDDLEVAELAVLPIWVGRPLKELDLPERLRLNVVAIRRLQAGRGKVLAPNANQPLVEGDILVTVGPPRAASRAMGSN
jgi:trk system potassium uptake protein TrkA